MTVIALLAGTHPLRPLSQQLSPVWGVTTVAGTGTVGDTGDGGQATKAAINKPVGVAIDKAGNIYISETSNVIRKVTPAGVISTIAGSVGKASSSGDGGPATAALLSSPYGLEIDRDGNLLIGDIVNQVIRKIDLNAGVIRTFAGAHAAGYTGDGGSAISAKMSTPYTAAGDSAGNVYIADSRNNVIRKVDTGGNISTFAGTGTAGHTGDGGPAKNATLSAPYSVWVDPAGNLYVDELGSGASYIRLIDTAGIIHTIAGVGTPGFTGDGGPATASEVNTPHGTVIDGLGHVYITDETNHVIRAVDSNGTITTIAGTFYTTKPPFSDGVAALSANFNFPYGLAIDSGNNLFLPDAGNYRIRRISLNTALPATATGAIATQKVFVSSTVAVTPSAATFTPSNEFSVGTLSGCTFGTQLAANAACTVPINFKPSAAGPRSVQLSITDSSGKVSLIGVTGTGTAPEAAFAPATISTVAGNGTAGFNKTAGPAASAQISAPRGGVVDGAGNLYFADSGNNSIRRIDAASGLMTTVVGTGQAGYSGDGSIATSAQLNSPAKVIVDAAGDLYIADTGNNVIRYVDAGSGNISTIAGTGTSAYTGDGGAATAATLNRPQGLAVDLGGHVYVADTGNNVIRYFGKGGQISTFIGNGTAGFAGDGGNAHDAVLNAPQAVLLDGRGNVYIADTGNAVVRMVSTTNKVSTIAGSNGMNANAGDGGLATSATLASPSDIAIDAAGDLYIAAKDRIRIIDGSGGISTIAGSGGTGAYSGEGGVATNAVLPAPASNIIVDSAANVYVAETSDNRLLEIASASPRTVSFGRQTPNTTGSSQRVLLLNVGNSPLQLSAITIAGPFALQTTDPTSCTPTSALAPGTSCSLTIDFSPTAVGTFNGSITLTDNALNNSASTQIIPLTGQGLLINTTTTTIKLSPTSPVYGQTTQAVATATVTGGVGATGSVTFTLNGVTIGNVPLSGTTASLNLPSLQAGNYSVAASYAGDDNNSSSSGSSLFTVQPAVVTVAVANVSRYTLYQANPTFTYTITGYVNGDTSSVVSGAPVLTTTATQASPVGSYPITASLGTLSAANYTFVLVNGTLSVTPAPPPDFTLTVAPASVAMENGGSATFTFSLASIYGYNGSVQFSCSAPANVNCSFAPPTLAANPNTVAISQLTVYLGSAYASAFGGTGWLAFVGILFTLSISLRRRKLAVSLTLSLAFLAGACGLSGCGETVNKLPGTGTSQVTITATDSTTKLNHSATVSLIIQ
jgi:sugar lactone lactonase YvrE